MARTSKAKPAPVKPPDPVPSSGGRPTKYRPEYCDEIIEFMGRGFSMRAFAGKIRVHEDTLQQWQKDHKEFSVAVKIAKCAAEHGLLIKFHGLATGKLKGQAAPIIFMLKNICGWREKIDTNQQISVTPHEYLTQLIEQKKLEDPDDEFS